MEAGGYSFLSSQLASRVKRHEKWCCESMSPHEDETSRYTEKQGVAQQPEMRKLLGFTHRQCLTDSDSCKIKNEAQLRLSGGGGGSFG